MSAFTTHKVTRSVHACYMDNMKHMLRQQTRAHPPVSSVCMYASGIQATQRPSALQDEKHACMGVCHVFQHEESMR